MKKRKKIIYIFLLISLSVFLEGCVLKSVSQVAWCKFLNVSNIHSYDTWNYSNILWSQDNKKIFFVASRYPIYRKIQWESQYDILYFMGFLAGDSVITKAYRKDKSSLHELFAVDVEKGEVKLLGRWEEQPLVDHYRKLVFLKIYLINESEICDKFGFKINMNNLQSERLSHMPETLILLPQSKIKVYGQVIDREPISLHDYGYRSWTDRKSLWINTEIIKPKSMEEWKKDEKRITLPEAVNITVTGYGEIKNNNLDSRNIFISSDSKQIAFYLFDIRAKKDYLCIVELTGSDLRLFRLH